MTREIKEKDFRQQWKQIKQEFENCQKKIRNYDSRPLDDNNRKHKYKKEIVEEYNKVITFIAGCIEQFTRDAQKQLLQKIDDLENILIKRLQTLGFSVQLPEDKLDVIDIALVTGETNLNISSETSDEIDESLDFEDENLDLNEIEIAGSSSTEDNKTVNVKEQAQNTIPQNLLNTNTMAPPDTDSFMNTCSRHLNKHFDGDPLERTAFLKSIKLLISVGVSTENKKLLANFVQTRLSGKASECVPENCEDIDEIVKAIKDNCKAENSKVISGRLMALKADRANLTDFAKRAETLCEAFQRSLILEGTSRAKATELTVDKTIDLCKANTNSTVVLSMLASSKFEDANEVIAKYTIVTRDNLTQNQMLHFRSNNRGRANFNRNSHNNSQSRYRNNNNGWNGNSQRYRSNNFRGNNNNNYRGNNFGNGRGHSRGNFQRNDKRQNNVYCNHASGNEQTPPPGENWVRSNQAENQN